MQLKYIESLTQANPGCVKVTAVCWSPNGKRLAICSTDRVVLMFDENGVKKDKFSTKPADKGPKNYIVRQMAFSPQSDKLAIAQSDNMVFVYKIGTEWGEKKSICNKFQHSSSISCLVWPSRRPNELAYGLAEGKVKIGQMKTHKPATLYQTESYVTCMTCNTTGDGLVSAHLDGSIYVFWFDNAERGAHLICRHSCVPFSLAWGVNIVVAGNNGQVTFYDEDGGEEQTFDMMSSDNLHGGAANCREFTAASCNPSGDSVVLGNFDALYIFTRNKESLSGWEHKGIMNVENMYSVTAMDWRPDGDKLAVGTLCGIVDLYDICVKRTMYKGGFELTYVSHSQVIVRKIETNMRIVIRSQFGREILKTNIYKNRYVVAKTTDTLLLGDFDTLRLSEIQSHATGSEKYIFDNPNACIIYFAGEATIVEFGLDEPLGSVRTTFTNSHVFSLRINERKAKVVDNDMYGGGGAKDKLDNKKVAFLLDTQSDF
jgi:intraflagellar transport protein 172